MWCEFFIENQDNFSGTPKKRYIMAAYGKIKCGLTIPVSMLSLSASVTGCCWRVSCACNWQITTALTRFSFNKLLETATSLMAVNDMHDTSDQ